MASDPKKVVDEIRAKLSAADIETLEHELDQGIYDTVTAGLARTRLMEMRRERAAADHQRATESLEIARRAATASETSARYAMWAAIISLVAVLASVAKDFIYPLLDRDLTAPAGEARK